jgi:hypothetical protein
MTDHFDREPDEAYYLGMVVGCDEASAERNIWTIDNQGSAGGRRVETPLEIRKRLRPAGMGRRRATDLAQLDAACLSALKSMTRSVPRVVTIHKREVHLRPFEIAVTISYLVKALVFRAKTVRGVLSRLTANGDLNKVRCSSGRHVNIYAVAQHRAGSNAAEPVNLENWQNKDRADCRSDETQHRAGSNAAELVNRGNRRSKHRAGSKRADGRATRRNANEFGHLPTKGNKRLERALTQTESGTEPPAVAATAVIDQDGIRPKLVAAFAARASGSVSTPAQPLDVVASVSADAGRKCGHEDGDLEPFVRSIEQQTVIEAEIVPDGERFANRSKVAGHDGNCLDGELLPPQRACGPIPDPRDANHARELLWGQVRGYLASQHGATEASVRSQLGKLRKSGDDLAIVRAAVTAQRTNVIDPLAYMRGVLKAKPGSRKGRTVSDRAAARAGFENLAQQPTEDHPTWVN